MQLSRLNFVDSLTKAQQKFPVFPIVVRFINDKNLRP